MTKKEMVNCIQVREQILRKFSNESAVKFGYFSDQAAMNRHFHQAILGLMGYMEIEVVE